LCAFLGELTAFDPQVGQQHAQQLANGESRALTIGMLAGHHEYLRPLLKAAGTLAIGSARAPRLT
jgi:hypothetical protein